MARSVPVEEESGTFTGQVHTHNGYYAGDFGDESPERRKRRFVGNRQGFPAHWFHNETYLDQLGPGSRRRPGRGAAP
jgi:hypothetical protein